MAGAGTVPTRWSIGRHLPMSRAKPLTAPQGLPRMNGAGESWRPEYGQDSAMNRRHGRAARACTDIRVAPTENERMRKLWITIAILAGLSAAVLPAQAKERTLTGAAIGAGVGAVVLGPSGAV